MDQIDDIISAELPTAEKDRILLALGKKSNICIVTHHNALEGLKPGTVDMATTRVKSMPIHVSPKPVLGRYTEGEEDQKAVSGDVYLMRKYRCHINVKRTQRGGAMAYLIRY